MERDPFGVLFRAQGWRQQQYLLAPPPPLLRNPGHHTRTVPDEGGRAGVLGVSQAHHQTIAQPPGQCSERPVHQSDVLPVRRGVILEGKKAHTHTNHKPNMKNGK